MHKVIVIIILTVTSMLQAQTKFEKGMQQAFTLWEENKPTEASHLFERIAQAESENWLPYYYASYIQVVYSFNESDKNKREAMLQKAQDLINDAQLFTTNNPELMVVQALLYTSWIAFDGATYGMSLSGKVNALYAKAKSIAPENPRVLLANAEWNIGSATYFGQDTTPFCKDLERALELFANFKPESSFHPNWGKERAEQLLKDCE